MNLAREVAAFPQATSYEAYPTILNYFDEPLPHLPENISF
jgi:hypothetical protein